MWPVTQMVLLFSKGKHCLQRASKCDLLGNRLLEHVRHLVCHEEVWISTLPWRWQPDISVRVRLISTALWICTCVSSLTWDTGSRSCSQISGLQLQRTVCGAASLAADAERWGGYTENRLTWLQPSIQMSVHTCSLLHVHGLSRGVQTSMHTWDLLHVHCLSCSACFTNARTPLIVPLKHLQVMPRSSPGRIQGNPQDERRRRERDT